MNNSFRRTDHKVTFHVDLNISSICEKSQQYGTPWNIPNLISADIFAVEIEALSEIYGIIDKDKNNLTEIIKVENNMYTP